MNTKQFGIIALASIALLALLGCVGEIVCTADAKVCPDGSGVGRNPALNCEFNPCPTACIGEGRTIPVIAEPPECCTGLTLIPPKEQPILGISGYCTAKCGNGTCDEIESALNCPADCEAAAGEQVVGPDAYANEQQAFDALAEEVDGMPELSDAELEALLGE